jgi:hypothetical protein
MNGLPALSEKDSQTVEELIQFVARDWNDIAINGAIVCNFCGNAVDEDDDGHFTRGHKRTCLYVRTRKIARKLNIIDTDE